MSHDALDAQQRKHPLVTDQASPYKPASTRLDIITAAARELAKKPYSLVDLDDILVQAGVTKSAMYTHVADVGDDMARAGLTLLESVGRFDGYQSTLVEA